MSHRVVTLETITAQLDLELETARFQDASNNGLQVANSGRLGVVCAGVDASLPFFEAAAAQGAGLLICHHGISWGDSLKRLKGLNYRLVSFLMEHDLALWACHLPLDAHPRYGNNAVLARALELKRLIPFGEYSGQTIGIRGAYEAALSRDEFKDRVGAVTGTGAMRCLDFGPGQIRCVGVISGGAAAEVEQAAEAGLDAYVTGEPTLQGYNLARQLNMNVVFAGHYATERFGVTAVAEWVRRRFKTPARFIDLDVPF